MTTTEQLLMTYGYEPIESKNEYMRSYKNATKRVNYYFTNGTVTIQPLTGRGIQVIKDMEDSKIEMLEDLLK
jgi:hypothetical protein